MNSLILPPNSGPQDRALVDAMAYPVDPSVMRGFKFNPPDAFLQALIWEYGLGELLRWLPDPRRAIREGVDWQRIRGTPESLRMALSWVNLGGVYLEEEVPGEHFSEFQVGVSADVPNDLFVDVVIELARLSAPIRTRLTRMYNEAYDIRRFILDSSQFGDFLSDYSGRRLTDDGPVLSFGRQNHTHITAGDVALHTLRHKQHSIAVLPQDQYRLDQVRLGEDPPHVLNQRAGYGRLYSAHNFGGLQPDLQGLDQFYGFAKAAVVLSDGPVLGDGNACLPARELIETGAACVLSEDALSETVWRLVYTPINERFFTVHQHDVVYDFAADGNFLVAQNHHERALWSRVPGGLAEQGIYAPVHEKLIDSAAQYGGVLQWHDHVHLDRPWSVSDVIVTAY